jgi:hypothetical protein
MVVKENVHFEYLTLYCRSYCLPETMGFKITSLKDNILKLTSIPPLSRAEDFRASSSSFNLLVAIAASSVFL